MAVYRLESDAAVAEISEHAAEIHSFRDRRTNTEHMWQGDPAFWSGRNPTLFPMVGSTWNKEVVIDGRVYHMGNHGFARHSEFACVAHDSSSLTMRLEDSPETLEQYPFRFRLDVTFTLQGDTLSVNYEITNRSDRTMPFNFGLHPAFRCPMAEGEKQMDYTLQFNHAETLDGKEFTSLPLERSALEQTIILSRPKSTEVTLANGIHGVRVHFEGYPWVAFWSAKNNAPFVCIEPWHSHTDMGEVKVPFEQREGTILLEAGKNWNCSYRIQVL